MQRKIVLQIDVDDNNGSKCDPSCRWFWEQNDKTYCELYGVVAILNPYNRCQRCIDSEVSDE